MKNKIIQSVTPEIELNSLNLSLIKRTLYSNYDPHFHIVHEIEFVVSGKCIHYINGAPIECKANSAIFVTPMDMHSIEVIEPVTIINLNFETNGIDPDIRSICNKNMYAHNLSDSFVNQLYEEFNSELDYNLQFQKCFLNCLMLQIIRHGKIFNNKNKNNVSLEIARYIQAHYNEELSLNTLSSVFGYTPNYLSNHFHRFIGKTIKQFILDTRLEHAAKLLLTTSSSVTDICYTTGFTSLSNFLRAFKSKYKNSPNAYRSNIDSNKIKI